MSLFCVVIDHKFYLRKRQCSYYSYDKSTVIKAHIVQLSITLIADSNDDIDAMLHPPPSPPGINDAPTPNALAPSIGPRQIGPAEGVGLVRHRHHCHPHHCPAIAIAVAAPPKPSLCRHRHRCAATFSAIAAPYRCAAIAALPPQSLRSHRLRHALPSPLPSLHRLSRRCAVIAIAVPPPSLPSLRPIAAPPLLRCHHNRCAATASAIVARPQQAHRSPERPSTMPLPPGTCR
jgi:hypothetical protein